MSRRLVALFLRSTARGSLVDALPDEPRGRFGRIVQALRLAKLMRWAGRTVGRFLSPAAKARIQDTLINRFRIPVNLQQDEDRLRRVLRRALRRQKECLGKDNVGHYLEFGVYQGNSMIQALHAVAEERLGCVRLFGFDSFAGLPDTAEEEGVWSNGQYLVDHDFARERIDTLGPDSWRANLVPGFFADTLTAELREKSDIGRAGVVMIDCDLYSSAKEALAFCEPLIDPETVVLFDDWHSVDESSGEQRAFREFLDEHPHLEAEEFEGHNENARGFVLRRLSSWIPGMFGAWQTAEVLDVAAVIEGALLAAALTC